MDRHAVSLLCFVAAATSGIGCAYEGDQDGASEEDAQIDRTLEAPSGSGCGESVDSRYFIKDLEIKKGLTFFPVPRLPGPPPEPVPAGDVGGETIGVDPHPGSPGRNTAP